MEKAKQALIERGADSEGEEEMDMALDQYHRDRLAKNVNEAREAEEMLGTGDRPVKSNNVASDDDVSDDDDDIGVEPRSGPSPPARGRGSKRGARVPRGGGRGSRGTGRGRGATANGNNSILNAFARQSQSQASGGSGTQTKRAASSRKKTPVVYDDDSE